MEDAGAGEYRRSWKACNLPKKGLAFTAEDRVKLSYHTDGFAQFSSETAGRIVSGIDADTGEPKGVGLFTQPLTSPVSTGPSVGSHYGE